MVATVFDVRLDALALNNFFLMSFPLVFLCALGVLRHFGVTWPTAVAVSLLYAFAPYHLLRGEHHPFLTAYWPVPLAVLVALWIGRDRLVAGSTEWSAGWHRRPWLAVLICAILDRARLVRSGQSGGPARV
ncbi:MAG: hypothetical protein HYY76_18765 [Acidobacteria bacterium]|nr:hypothetical protein [Acidobacteriota bacterium]